MFLPRLKRISPPRTPQIHDHDTTTITHEHIPEIFSPDSAQQPSATYYRPSPLGLFVEGNSTHFPPATQMEVFDAPPPPQFQVEGYTIEGGWQPDGFGGLRYQEYGKVEDINGSNSHFKKSKSDSEGNSMIPGDYDGSIMLTRPLPSTATPPPAPSFRARPIEIPEVGFTGNLTSAPGVNLRAMPYPKRSSLNPRRVGSSHVDQHPPMTSTPPPGRANPSPPETDSHHPLFYSSPNPGQGRALSVGLPVNRSPQQNTNPSIPETQSPVRERPTRPPPLSPSRAVHELDDSRESTILQSNLRIIHTALRSLDYMNRVFQSARNPEDIRAQLGVDMCGRIKEILFALTAALNRRGRFTEEHWKLRSQTWHKKYIDRLLSLRRTLQRLSSLEDRMKGSRLGLKAINKALEKLRQFEYKLSDLNSGFNKMFDRLKARQLHAMLTESITEEQRMRRSDFSTRDAYKNKQMEGKAMRARLRRDYLVYSTGCRLSLVI